MYDYCDPRTTWRPSLVVSVSNYGTSGIRSIPGWAHILQCLFSFSSSVFILNYFILHVVICNYKNNEHFHSFTFYIELHVCTNYMNV